MAVSGKGDQAERGHSPESRQLKTDDSFIPPHPCRLSSLKDLGTESTFPTLGRRGFLDLSFVGLAGAEWAGMAPVVRSKVSEVRTGETH